MASLEPYEMVYISNYSSFEDDFHGKLGCTVCHGGDSSVGYSTAEDYEATTEDKESAHTADLVADPSDTTCSACHEDHVDIASTNAVSLHTTVSGMQNALEIRGGDLSDGSVLAEAFHNHCAECHTSCGQCHVSRPDMADGGFIYSHEFVGTPSMTDNCTACHGSRIGNEYLGNNEGCEADVHYADYDMDCFDCHSSELHDTGDAETRYENCNSVSCTDSGCHDDILIDSNNYHKQHVYQHQDYDEGDTSLQCQVCHSTTYKNCYGCHVYLDENDLPYYETESSPMDFEIGLNPLDTEPYDYVVLRHAPISIDTFEEYGDNLLPDFDSLSTWKYATPHNIQLSTPQTENGCNSCHGQNGYFLLDGDVATDEKSANDDVIVGSDDVPDTIT